MGFLDKIKQSFDDVQDKFQYMTSELSKVIKQNEDILKAQEQLSKETKEGIEAIREYGKTEEGNIGEVIQNISQSMEIVETNRMAMKTQLENEYIQPLKELVDDWLHLQDLIKEEKKSQKNKEKAKKNLENKRQKKEKKPDKVTQEDIDEAAQELSEAFEQAKQKREELETKTIQFEQQKATTLKSALTGMIESQLQFHKQAMNIINSMHGELNKIDTD